jgi:sialate O-acetylesterase
MNPARIRPPRFWVSLVLACAVFGARAEVRLPGLFTDDLVLQQAVEAPVWGWADDGERVTVTFRGRQVSATTQNGRWMVRLPTRKAGGPFTLTVEGKNRIDLPNVLVGEVWLASGQSNMEWPLERTDDAATAINAAANPNLRLFTVPKRRADAPVDDVKARWVACTPETVKGFSAVAYYFGRDLQRARGVPVGLIHTSWGGSPAEVWMRQEVLAAHPDYRREILDPYPAQAKKYQEDLAKWERETEALQAEGKPAARARPWAPWKPAELYNGMIAPLIPFAVKGALWYQGESNASRAHQYRTLFPNLIQNWRDDWRRPDLTFLLVQLAPWDRNQKRSPEEIAAAPGESDWAELREAQLLTAQTLPKVGMAVITDVGDKDDIHPTKKEPVGARLALAARAIAYGERLVYSGPIYQAIKVKKDRAILSFDHVGGGLEARGGRLRGFALAGEDGKFMWANAEIDGNHVVVTSPLVSRPAAVRYGWADYPIVNLFNREGLPASPFRTDDFPLTTAPRE